MLVKKILKKPIQIIPVGIMALACATTGLIPSYVSYANADETPTTVGYEIEKISKDGTNQLKDKQYPDFSNADAYINSHYGQKQLFGQCTWFASGRFTEIYGYQPDFTGDGYMCVDQLLAKHSDKFYRSNTPVVGAIGSSDFWHNHVWIVVGVDEDGDGLTIQEGNIDQITNDWTTGCSDWREKHYTFEELHANFGDYEFANPNETPVEAFDRTLKEQEEESKKTSVKTAVDALTGDVNSVKKLAGSTNTDVSTEINTKKTEVNLGAASLIMKQNPVDDAKDIKDIDTTSNEYSAQDISNNLIKAMQNGKKHSK